MAAFQQAFLKSAGMEADIDFTQASSIRICRAMGGWRTTLNASTSQSLTPCRKRPTTALAPLKGAGMRTNPPDYLTRPNYYVSLLYNISNGALPGRGCNRFQQTIHASMNPSAAWALTHCFQRRNHPTMPRYCNSLNSQDQLP